MQQVVLLRMLPDSYIENLLQDLQLVQVYLVVPRHRSRELNQAIMGTTDSGLYVWAREKRNDKRPAQHAELNRNFPR